MVVRERVVFYSGWGLELRRTDSTLSWPVCVVWELSDSSVPSGQQASALGKTLNTTLSVLRTEPGAKPSTLLNFSTNNFMFRAINFHYTLIFEQEGVGDLDPWPSFYVRERKFFTKISFHSFEHKSKISQGSSFFRFDFLTKKAKFLFWHFN